MTVSASSYAVGNRVYGGGSSAPTMGTVDPSGYVERSLNNQASDSRSGLAEAALRRLGGSGGGQESPTGPAGPVGPMPDMAALMGGPMPIIPTVRDAVRARMNPDGTYSLNVRQLQEQVASAHDYAQAAQRALMMMQPIPMPPEPAQQETK